MIRINLLPEELAAGKGGDTPASENAGAVLVAFVLLVLFGANVVLGGYLFMQKRSVENELERARAEASSIRETLRATEDEYRVAKADLERMQELIEVAQALDPPDRLLWSRKLNMLPLLVPEGIYLTKIEVSQRVTERETEDSIRARNEWMKNKRGDSPTPVRVPVYNQTLNLEGIAYVPDGLDTQRLDQVIRFIRALQEQPVKLPFEAEPTRFMESFRPKIDYAPLTQTTVAGRDVTVFRFNLTANPMTIR